MSDLRFKEYIIDISESEFFEDAVKEWEKLCNINNKRVMIRNKNNNVMLGIKKKKFIKYFK